MDDGYTKNVPGKPEKARPRVFTAKSAKSTKKCRFLREDSFSVFFALFAVKNSPPFHAGG
jgi:hypothetical protein